MYVNNKNAPFTSMLLVSRVGENGQFVDLEASPPKQRSRGGEEKKGGRQILLTGVGGPQFRRSSIDDIRLWVDVTFSGEFCKDLSSSIENGGHGDSSSLPARQKVSELVGADDA